MASVKKLARLAFIAQQFGYEYADVRQGGGRNNALKMIIVPDPGPQAQARAAQNWAQFPQAGDGQSLPPVVPDALELLKARINFDLTGKNAQQRMLYGVLGVTVACVVLAVRTGGDAVAFSVAGALWVLVMAVFGIGFVVTRKRNAKFAARLRAAGFTPMTEEGGRVRYLPPAPYAQQVAGQAAGPYAPPPPPPPPAPGPYGQQAPGSYAPQTPGSYALQTPGRTRRRHPARTRSKPPARRIPAAKHPAPTPSPPPYPHRSTDSPSRTPTTTAGPRSSSHIPWYLARTSLHQPPAGPRNVGRQPHRRAPTRVRATFHSGHPQPQAGNAPYLPSVLIPPVPDLSTGEPWRRHDSP
ncbi:hypothetical protein [Streptomyces sp. NBC_00658]|uniref:hypothetical protein n=1 Tax=Streptomyces sp. NBC_00658 TaxID=2975800 RepID=UPI003243C82B